MKSGASHKKKLLYLGNFESIDMETFGTNKNYPDLVFNFKSRGTTEMYVVK